MTASPTIIDMAALSRVPVAPDRFVGWVRACIAVGHSLYGEGWDDAQKARIAYGAAERAAEVEDLVAKQFPAPTLITRAPEAPTRLQAPPRKPIDPETLERIRAGAQKIREQRTAFGDKITSEMPSLADMAATNLQRKGMLANAQAALFDAVLNSRVPAFWWKDGSTTLPSAMSVAHVMTAWNSHRGRENLSRRGYVWTDRSARYVYVGAAELAVAFPPFTPARDEAAMFDLPHLSPFIRVMLRVARAANVTPDHQPSVDELIFQIGALAPALGVTLSDRQKKEMARLIRDPAP